MEAENTTLNPTVNGENALAVIPAVVTKYDVEIDAIQERANTIDAQDDNASALCIWQKLEAMHADVVAFKVKTTLEFYHIGKLLLIYRDERKCKNHVELLAALQLDLQLRARSLKLKDDFYKLDSAMINRALLCRKQGTEANALGCFGTWARTVNPADARKVLDKAADRTPKKAAVKLTTAQRILKMIRDDISMQASLEAIACECIYKLRDEKRLTSVVATASHGIALAEDKARHEMTKTVEVNK